MSKILKLADGTEFTCAVVSTITSIVLPINTWGGIDDVTEKFTDDNLKGVNFDGVNYNGIILESVSATKVAGNIVAHFNFRLSEDDRVARERQEAVDEYTLQLVEEGLL